VNNFPRLWSSVSRSQALYEQLQKKATLYRGHVVLLPHGDDFRYSGVAEWTEQMGNMQLLMDYINGNDNMNMKVSLKFEDRLKAY